MKHLKFRAWDGQQMISPDYIDRNGVAYWKENSVTEWSKNVMQYTGLKDCNDVEIYEGDIVEVKIEKKHDYAGTGTYVVIYDAPEFKMKPLSFSDSISGLFGEGKIFGNQPSSIWKSELKNITVIDTIYKDNQQ